MENKKQKLKDDYVMVLDMVSQKGYSSQEIVQVVGNDNYSLLELVPKQGSDIEYGEELYIGEDKREKIQFIKRAIKYEDLSNSSQGDILEILEKIVKKREEEYVNFFNKCGSISLRKHALELLSGVGKKHVTETLLCRVEKPFENFEDIKKRTAIDPVKGLSKRILSEIKGEDTILFFIKR